MTEKRFRINAKQTAKGSWYLDATVESGTDELKIHDESDLAKFELQSLGQSLLNLIKQTESLFIADGKRLVTDEQ